MTGKAVLIGNQDFINTILNFRKFAGNKFQTNWLIGFGMDFDYEIKVINKKHPKHKQILKMINTSVEHGIKQRAEDLYGYGTGILFYLFEKLSNSKVFIKIKYEINKKRDKFTLNELSSLFVLLISVFPCLFLVFIIEIIIYK